MAHTEGKHHRTADINYAAYLKVAGVPFYDTERQGKRVVYLFEHTDALGDLKRQYFNRQAKVVALDYTDEIKALRSLTYTD